MNSQTGEIREGIPSKEFDKALHNASEKLPAAFDIPLSPMEREILEMVEPPMRATIMANWRDKEQIQKFNGIVEKSKVKAAFLGGAVMGIFLAADQKKLDAAAQKETINESSPRSPE